MASIWPYTEATVRERSLSSANRRTGPVITAMPSSVTTTVEKRGIRIESAVDLIMLSPIERILGTATNPSSMRPPIHIEAAALWKKSRSIGPTCSVAAACAIRLDVTSAARPRISIAYISALLAIVLFLASLR
jgi:hypothetical protein